MMGSRNDIVLSTNNLSIGYPGTIEKEILGNLNLKLLGGQLVSFMGPNGVGKTTLLRTLAGLMPPLHGTIQILNREIDNYTLPELAQKLSVVLTDPVQVGNLSVKEIISMGRYPYINWFLKYSSIDIQKIEEAISLVQLDDLSERKFHELSDGQAQKVLIARALAQDGDIMILDEPNSHLDLNNRVEIMRILRSLCRKTGKTILVATHELDLALQTSDWLWLATNEGKIIDGIPEDLVLNDSFDTVFDTKGFDLKTGRIIHEDKTIAKISLRGSGYIYLWTKNALERNGFEVIESDSETTIRFEAEGPKWIVKYTELEETHNSLKSLILSLTNHNFSL